jgi:4-diphosphocytidyl-2-C-methyl-D-erythritol kinase
MRVLAPAKVNLSLRVLGRRADGFHELESLLAPVSVFDELEFEPHPDGAFEFVCSAEGVPSDERNLVVRAVRLFCESCGLQPGLRVVLHKQIPHGAGLGGGSSDAAATLMALDALFQTRLERDALVRMAADLGSDVPFFLYQSPAWMRGRGELVNPVRGMKPVSLLLLKPPFGVPTPWAYQRWADSRCLEGIPYAEQALDFGGMVNDLERPVFEKYLFLADLKRWLIAQPEVRGALLSGSGSTVFAVLNHREAGFALGERVAAEFGGDLWAYLCETLP